jgi:hypothetical protein
MRPSLLACLIALAWSGASTAQAADWHLQTISAPARVMAIETVGGVAQVNAGGLWYRLAFDAGKPALVFIDNPAKSERPKGALPNGRVVTGKRDIMRVWLADPTTRYDHGILGDKVEAGSLVIETRGGKRHVVKLKDDAVFEDIEPRLADLDGDGFDEVVVVKSSLKRGSSLAVVAEHKGKYEIVAETPPLGAPHRWLDPAGIADFNGDGQTDIALVRQPHVVGALELWSWHFGRLNKTAEFAGVANHIAGTRAIDMSAVADMDGDGIADLAVPSLDRSRLRFIGFVPGAHEIASLPLPAKAVTNLGLVKDASGKPAIAVGLDDGTLVVARRSQ